jgi:PIN domain nuclease of toxin-antitoxin system
MQLLIDTHIFIWSVIDSEKLGTQARQIILDAARVFVSSASIWEIAIKVKLGKLEGDPNEFATAIGKSGFSEIPISVHHAAKVYELPLYHRDPFDRMIIAQSLYEPLRLLTADKMLGRYSELVITA